MHLTTPRLVLREFSRHDWADVLAYQRDPRYLRFYPWTDRTEADARRFVDQQSDQPRRKLQLAITLADSGLLIGNCGIRRKSENDWEADIGYELAPDYWGQGYATEAALAIVQFGFQELRIHRISSWCIADNVASVRVLDPFLP